MSYSSFYYLIIGLSLSIKDIENKVDIFRDKLFGMRTPCNHCFHMNCLAKWASIKIIEKNKNRNIKGDCWVNDRDENTIKSFEGLVRGEENEIKNLETQKLSLINTINEVELNIRKRTEEEIHDEKSNEKNIEQNGEKNVEKNAEKNPKIKTKNTAAKKSTAQLVLQKNGGNF